MKNLFDKHYQMSLAVQRGMTMAVHATTMAMKCCQGEPEKLQVLEEVKNNLLGHDPLLGKDFEISLKCIDQYISSPRDRTAYKFVELALVENDLNFSAGGLCFNENHYEVLFKIDWEYFAREGEIPHLLAWEALLTSICQSEKVYVDACFPEPEEMDFEIVEDVD